MDPFNDLADPDFQPSSDPGTLIRSYINAYPGENDEQLAARINERLQGVTTFTPDDVAGYRPR